MATLFAQLTAEQEAELRQRIADAPRDVWLASGQPVSATSGRRPPRWSPTLRRHTWSRLDLPHAHRCGHCGLCKLSAQERPGDDRTWFTVWVDRDGRLGSTLLHGTTPGLVRARTVPDCPGPGAVEGAGP